MKSKLKVDLKTLTMSHLLILFTNSESLLNVMDINVDGPDPSGWTPQSLVHNEIVLALNEIAAEIDRRFPMPAEVTP